MKKNQFPGATAFVETFDTEEDAESSDILSFNSLREAFAMPLPDELELSTEVQEESERPDYDIEETLGMEDESEQSALSAQPSDEPSISIGVRLETIIEAMLFVGNRENRPLTADQIAEKLRNVSEEEVDQAVIHLNGHYQERNYPYTIIAERGGYRMVLRSEFESVRSNFYGKVRETRLSQQAIDTLAVVAYRQPITADEIQTLRRQSCTGILNQLVRRHLLCTRREVQEDKKNVVHYHTTPRFLELLQIKSLNDMPRVEELE